MTDLPVVAHDLKPQDFPFVIQTLDPDTLKEVWRATVDGPGALRVPGWGRPMVTRVWYPNGTVVETRTENGMQVTRVYDLSDELKEILNDDST